MFQDEPQFTSLKDPKELLNFIFSGVSLITIIAGLVFIVHKKKLFTVYRLLLMIQISEALNCIAKFLLFIKNRDQDVSPKNLLNIIVCQTQVFLLNFADFCTLLFNNYVCIILYFMLKDMSHHSYKNNIYIFLGIIFASMLLSLLFLFLNAKVRKQGFEYNENVCTMESGLNMITYILYWLLIFINCFVLYKSISILKDSAKAYEEYEGASDDISDERGNKEEEYNSQEGTENSEQWRDSDQSNHQKIKNFIRKFLTFMILFCILWAIMFIYNLLGFLIDYEKIDKNLAYEIFTYAHIGLSGLTGVFYSFCYFFILTNFGGTLFKGCCCNKSNNYHNMPEGGVEIDP